MIPFSPPYIRQEAIDEVVDTLKSGWITTGPKTKRFEKEITRYCGNRKTLCVSSATFGLELILRWFGVGPGDEVIVPAYTYCATANVVKHTGARLVLVDVEEDTLTLSPRQVSEAVTSRTKVILPVDLAGLPAGYEELYALVNEPKLKRLFRPGNPNQKKLGRILILTDAAHSFGAWYKGKRAGSYSDVTVFSFHAVKNITTAEGGAVALNLPEAFDCEKIYDYLNGMSLHGQSKDALAKVTDRAGWEYDVPEPGLKGNMTDIQASLGLIALKYYDTETLPARKRIMERYQQAFSALPYLRLPVLKKQQAETAYHLYLLRMPGITSEQRNEIIRKIFDRGVAVNVHYKPLPLLSAYRDHTAEAYPVSLRNYAWEISLPVYEQLTDEQVEKVIDVCIECIMDVCNP